MERDRTPLTTVADLVDPLNVILAIDDAAIVA
jgi:hypothetical protein